MRQILLNGLPSNLLDLHYTNFQFFPHFSLHFSLAETNKVVRKPISKEKAAKLEALKSRPRRRPDWSDMMKEVESGRKLKHVQCNDRSAPVLPDMKAKGQVNNIFY